MPDPDPKVIGTESPGQQQLQDSTLEALLPILAQFAQGQNPFQDIATQAAGPAQQTSIDALTQILNQGPEGLLRSAQPVFQENFQFGLGALANQAPATRSSAFGNQAIDFATRQDNAFNLFAQNALQNFQGNQIAASGQLADIAAQNQAASINPAIQLLLGALGQGFPGSAVVQPQSGLRTGADILTQLGLAAAGLIPAIRGDRSVGATQTDPFGRSGSNPVGGSGFGPNTGPDPHQFNPTF